MTLNKPSGWEDWIGTVKQGDCLDLMKQMQEGVVHCVVTSPPYFGLRDYQTEGQMGLEKTPELYVSKMVEVFREVKRIMHPTATLWLNLGDSYASGGGEGRNRYFDGRKEEFGPGNRPKGSSKLMKNTGLKPKDLLEMPSRLVLALQADGWWLRSRIPWLKRNAMPESCTDRPTQAVEYVFLLSKSKDYYYDGEAVRVPAARIDTQTFGGAKARRNKIKKGDPRYRGGHEQWGRTVTTGEGGRSRRNSDWFFESWQGLWTDENGWPLAFIVNPKPYKRAHFATFPPGLVIPCLKAGTSERGACPECGSPWVRVVRTESYITRPTIGRETQKAKQKPEYSAGLARTGGHVAVDTKTLGWRPTCSCSKEPVPCLAFDPFAGTGTVIEVARKMGRSGLGFEISEEYVKKYCQERLAQGVLGLKS